MKLKSLVVLACAAILSLTTAIDMNAQNYSPDDFEILSDTVKDGYRTISATPSPIVCPKRIDVKISAKTNVIELCVFTGGCPGNLKAINKLIKGLTVDQVIEKLDGINCGKRETSCTDQLSRILKKAYGRK